MKKIILENKKFTQDYWVTEDGKVFNKTSGKWLVGDFSSSYHRYTLKTDCGSLKVLAHRLVLKTFNPIENMDNLEVNHIDGNKLNNLVSNLEWVTRKENMIHAKENGLLIKTLEQKIKMRSLTEEDADEIIQLLLENKLSIPQIAAQYGVHKETISRINRKISWIEKTKDVIFPVKQDKSIGKHSLSEKQATEVIKLLKEKKTRQEIANLFNVSVTTIARIKQGKTWTELPR